MDYRTGEKVGHVQSELAAFYAELLAKGGDREAGAAYYDAFTAVLDRYGIIPEGFDYRTLAADGRSRQRAAAGVRQRVVRSMVSHARAEVPRHGVPVFHGAARALPRRERLHDGQGRHRAARWPLGDYFPAYAFAENFKYLYLMFAQTPRFDEKTYYMSTEGKLLRGLVR